MSEYVVQSVMPETRFGLTGIESIKQNVQIIATTFAGTCTLDRELGVDPSILDQPENYARLLMIGAIIEAVETGEPRVEVISVDSVAQDDGEQSGKAVYSIKFREREVV